MSGLVYSTESGNLCNGCGKPMASCQCHIASDGIVRVGRETKGRKGNGVTIITGIPLSCNELPQLAKQLKQRCGCGGSVKNGVIEIQGDKRDMLLAELQARGYKVKKSGG